MPETALRRDLRDEQAILNFANQLKGLDQLRMLYLLTFADIKAVGPEAWTSWKNSLLMELFLKTAHLLERQDVGEELAKGEQILKKLKERLPQDLVSP
jgi:[protein-PII] uridylyltransferase